MQAESSEGRREFDVKDVVGDDGGEDIVNKRLGKDVDNDVERSPPTRSSIFGSGLQLHYGTSEDAVEAFGSMDVGVGSRSKEGDVVSRDTNKSSWDDNVYSAVERRTRRDEETAQRHRNHEDKVDRPAMEKALGETSLFRCLAPCQKFRNFSMYFILNQIAGYSCVAFMGVNILVQLVMIVIGFVYFNDCEMESLLSTWNICAGTTFGFKMFTAMMFLAVMRKDIHLTGGVPEKTTIYKSPRYFCLFGIVDCLLFSILVVGMSITLPHLDCMATTPPNCHTEEKCKHGPYWFSVAAMAFLVVVYAIGYSIGCWVSGCFFVVASAEEAAGKTIKGYSKLKNRSSWNIKAEEQKDQNRKRNKNRDLKKKKKKKPRKNLVLSRMSKKIEVKRAKR